MSLYRNTDDRPKVKLSELSSECRFTILARCQHAAKKANWDVRDIDIFLEEATNGNHNNLIATCRKYFNVY